ncbi:vasodilator-stimulated phosphoprotein [Biomphalaria glabrata]|nr:vasodilator-stimulated phosphoprotein [Biomphalaria glabrata]
MSSEVPIISARASVMIYDDSNKKWIPSGTSQGLSKVQIYQHTGNNTFRVVGRKITDHEVSSHSYSCITVSCPKIKLVFSLFITQTFEEIQEN